MRLDELDAAVGPQPQHAFGQLRRRVLQRDLGAMAGPHLEEAPAEQEAHEHRERIEVDVAAERAAGIECRAAAGDERDRDAERDREVHADAALLQRAPGAGEERRGREPQHRQGEQPAAPVEQPLLVGREVAGRAHVGRHREHHDLHGAEGGHEETPQRASRLLAAQRARRGHRVGSGVVAGRLDRAHERRRFGLARVPAHGGAARGGADACRQHAGHAAQRDLDGARAGGAMHAADEQRRFRDARCLGRRRAQRTRSTGTRHCASTPVVTDPSSTLPSAE